MSRQIRFNGLPRVGRWCVLLGAVVDCQPRGSFQLNNDVRTPKENTEISSVSDRESWRLARGGEQDDEQYS